jgi:hypothetical protein
MACAGPAFCFAVIGGYGSAAARISPGGLPRYRRFDRQEGIPAAALPWCLVS